jgi:hypothetical protein
LRRRFSIFGNIVHTCKIFGLAGIALRSDSIALRLWSLLVISTNGFHKPWISASGSSRRRWM